MIHGSRFVLPTFLTLMTVIGGQARAESFLWLPTQRAFGVTCAWTCPGIGGRGTYDHRATDYGTPTSTNIVSAASGQVVAVLGVIPQGFPGGGGYGNHVRIRHSSGYETRYAHLLPNTITVRVGDRVTAGQFLGLSDNTGKSTGPHLHFEVRDPLGRRVNPYGDPPDYTGGCGPGALWTTCPPTPYHEDTPTLVDLDGDDFPATIDCDDHDPEVHPGANERCDGIDNDCDGRTDGQVSYDGIAVRCSVGIGACARDGTQMCGRNHETICDVQPGNPTAEQCNGTDDDCDGATDEDFWSGLANDIGNSCVVGIGACANAGTWICAPDGRATVCSGTALPPQLESCNGLDDDCDGETDENWHAGLATDLGQPCAITWESGACPEVTWGVWTCAPDGRAVVCDAADPMETPMQSEVCNGMDDDCNGVIDDVDPAMLRDDRANCGQCGNACRQYTNCTDGQCISVCRFSGCSEYCKAFVCGTCTTCGDAYWNCVNYQCPTFVDRGLIPRETFICYCTYGCSGCGL